MFNDGDKLSSYIPLVDDDSVKVSRNSSNQDEFKYSVQFDLHIMQDKTLMRNLLDSSTYDKTYFISNASI